LKDRRNKLVDDIFSDGVTCSRFITTKTPCFAQEAIVVSAHPTEDELRDRILRQLQWRAASETVACVWGGYLAALLEWGLISAAVHERLTAMLPRGGEKELDELFSGQLMTAEREREIDAALARDTSER
jgi:hypothetical protein